jgi:hypothetical protein
VDFFFIFWPSKIISDKLSNDETRRLVATL